MKSFQHTTIEQLIRMGMNTVGTAILGTSVVQGELFQAAVGGSIAVGSFVWWMIRERAVKK